MPRGVSLTLLTLAVVAGVYGQDIARGGAALEKFDLDTALSAYRAALAQSPNNYEATWKLARALADKATLSKDRAGQKRYSIEAEQLARAAVALNPSDSKGHAYLAVAVGKIALYEGGKRKVGLAKEVRSEALRALRLNDKEDVAYHVIGLWNREMAELNWVLRKFAEFLYGELPEASLDDAIRDLRRATEILPAAVAHRVELGVTLADARKWSEANDALEKALALPKSRVTDEYYWEIAKRNLKRVKAHLPTGTKREHSQPRR